MVVDRPHRPDAPLVVELELLDRVLGERRRIVADVRGLLREVLLGEARRLGQQPVGGLGGVALRVAGIGPGPTHQRHGDVLAVRRRRRPPDEERPAVPRLTPHELLGDLAGHVGRVVLRVLRAPVAVRAGAEGVAQVLDDAGEPAGVGGDLDAREPDQLVREVRVAPRLEATVEVHHEVVVVVGRDVEQAAPDVEALGHLAVRVLGAVAVQPLADQGGAVARLLQPPRQRVGAALHAVPAVRVEVARDAVVVRVLAGDERRPGRTAERKESIASANVYPAWRAGA